MPLLGEWEGSIRTWAGEVPLRLRVQPDDDIHVRLGNQLESLLNDAKLSDGVLTGNFAGTLPKPDS